VGGVSLRLGEGEGRGGISGKWKGGWGVGCGIGLDCDTGSLEGGVWGDGLREGVRYPDAACRPRPREPPVTTATLPSSEKMFWKSLSWVCAWAVMVGEGAVCVGERDDGEWNVGG